MLPMYWSSDADSAAFGLTPSSSAACLDAVVGQLVEVVVVESGQVGDGAGQEVDGGLAVVAALGCGTAAAQDEGRRARRAPMPVTVVRRCMVISSGWGGVRTGARLARNADRWRGFEERRGRCSLGRGASRFASLQPSVLGEHARARPRGPDPVCIGLSSPSTTRDPGVAEDGRGVRGDVGDRTGVPVRGRAHLDDDPGIRAPARGSPGRRRCGRRDRCASRRAVRRLRGRRRPGAASAAWHGDAEARSAGDLERIAVRRRGRGRAVRRRRGRSRRLPTRRSEPAARATDSFVSGSWCRRAAITAPLGMPVSALPARIPATRRRRSRLLDDRDRVSACVAGPKRSSR